MIEPRLWRFRDLRNDNLAGFELGKPEISSFCALVRVRVAVGAYTESLEFCLWRKYLRESIKIPEERKLLAFFYDRLSLQMAEGRGHLFPPQLTLLRLSFR